MPDRLEVAPHDKGIDESLAALISEVRIAEAETPPVVRVVGGAQVRRQVAARDRPGTRRIALQDDGLLGRQ
jgi:hypothetical protein